MTGFMLCVVLVASQHAAFAPGGASRQEAATRPATGPGVQRQDELAEARRIARQEIDRQAARVPVGQPLSMAEILSARQVNGFILVELKVPPTSPRVVAPLADDAGALVEIRTRRSQPESGIGILLQRVGDTGQEVISNTHLFTSPSEGELRIGRDSESLNGETLNISLAQLGASTDDPGAGVRLVVHRSHPEDDARNATVNLEADNLAALEREHPAIYAEYVRPMLQELGLTSVLEPSVREAAIQVFLAELPVEEEIAEQARRLLAELDAPDYARRVEAQQQLEQLDRAGATAVARMVQDQTLSPEQSTRISAVLAPFRPLQPGGASRRRDDLVFLERVAALSGSPEDEALARLARERLAELKASAPATRPAPDPR